MSRYLIKKPILYLLGWNVREGDWGQNTKRNAELPPSLIDPFPSPASHICPTRVASRFRVGTECSKCLSFLSLATGKPGPSCGHCSHGIEHLPRAAALTRFRIREACSGPSGCWNLSSLTTLLSQWASRPSPSISGCLGRLYEFCFLLFIWSCGLSLADPAEVSKPHWFRQPFVFSNFFFPGAPRHKPNK